MRFSPAGVQIVAARLLHSSEQFEAGGKRLVEFEVATLAAGNIADKLVLAPLGAMYRFNGFMARKNRNSKTIVFHLTDFEPVD